MPTKPRNWLLVWSRRPVIRLSLITVGAGILLVALPPLGLLSYDLSYEGGSQAAITNVVMILFDERTLQELSCVNNELNRTDHARLLQRLAKEQDKPKLVFYDVVFAETNEADQTLAQAIKQQGGVILAAGCHDTELNGSQLQKPTKPVPVLRSAAKGWGHTELFATPPGDVRARISGDCGDFPYAVWVAATNLEPVAFAGSNPNLVRWLNYYGPPGKSAIPHVPFEDALETNGPMARPVGFFKDKIVFVGEGESTLGKIGKTPDTFPTPYSLFGYPPMPGVQIHANALLNLMRNDWLRQISLPWQWCMAAAWGIAISAGLYGLSRKPRIVLVVTAAAGAILLIFGSLFVQRHYFQWWSWVGPAFGQTATALVLVRRSPKPDPYIAFISYRTEDDGAAALLISRSLAERGLKTFLDVRSLESGKFDEQLLQEIENSTFFIPILSQKCLARCKDPNDWVLREITHALALRKVIIPVMRSGFSFGPGTDIPDLPQLTELSRYHGVQYSNADFEGFLDQLIARLKGSDRPAEKVLN